MSNFTIAMAELGAQLSKHGLALLECELYVTMLETPEHKEQCYVLLSYLELWKKELRFRG